MTVEKSPTYETLRCDLYTKAGRVDSVRSVVRLAKKVSHKDNKNLPRFQDAVFMLLQGAMENTYARPVWFAYNADASQKSVVDEGQTIERAKWDKILAILPYAERTHPSLECSDELKSTTRKAIEYIGQHADVETVETLACRYAKEKNMRGLNMLLEGVMKNTYSRETTPIPVYACVEAVPFLPLPLSLAQAKQDKQSVVARYRAKAQKPKPAFRLF